MLLLIDNYDSFVFNLARYFERLGQPTIVRRNDRIDAAEVRSMGVAAVVISPGPSTPNEAGRSLQLVRELHRELPILGVCLGHQTIAAALGGHIVRAAEPMHGRASTVVHDGVGLFAGAPNPLTACRYHSLIVDDASLPPQLQVTARTTDGIVMAIAHRALPVVGVQFHPESILTDSGYLLLANFLKLAGLATPGSLPSFDTERLPAAATPYRLPDMPVTF